MGPRLTAHLERIGYMEEGSGSITVTGEPVPQLRPLHLKGQEAHTGTKAVIYAHGLPDAVLRHEHRVLLSEKFAGLGLTEADITVAAGTPASGSGNAVIVTTQHGTGSDMVFGEYLQRNRLPQKVAEIAARHALDHIRSGCAVDYPTSCLCRWPWLLAAASR